MPSNAVRSTEAPRMRSSYLRGDGWGRKRSERRAGDGVTSVDGIRPGVTTLSALKGERAVREIDSTLPGEFEYTSADFGTIRGFSEGDTITALQAGLGCVYR